MKRNLFRFLGVSLAGIIGLTTPSAPALGQERLTGPEIERLRAEIRARLFVPEPLPPLAPEVHGRIEPAEGVVAERISYGTEFGMRVPAILYLPKGPRE